MVLFSVGTSLAPAYRRAFLLEMQEVLSVVKKTDSLSFTLCSDTALIHAAVRVSEGFAHEQGVKDTLRVSVVLRELLSNAISHGNRNIPDRKVNCRIDGVRRGGLRIVVQDEGDGFDFASLETSLPDDPRSVRNRGYVLIHNICDSVEFNEPGNQVTVLIGTANQLAEERILR